jgi:hypothetical protein
MAGSTNATRFCWIAGTLLAVAGVVVKRVGAPSFQTPKAEALCAVAGIAIVSVGLGVIAYGISRRRLWKIAQQANIAQQTSLQQLSS